MFELPQCGHTSFSSVTSPTMILVSNIPRTIRLVLDRISPMCSSNPVPQSSHLEYVARRRRLRTRTVGNEQAERVHVGAGRHAIERPIGRQRVAIRRAELRTARAGALSISSVVLPTISHVVVESSRYHAASIYSGRFPASTSVDREQFRSFRSAAPAHILIQTP